MRHLSPRDPRIAFLAAACFLSSCRAAVRPVPPSPPKTARPNIILILTDDMDLTPLPHMASLQSLLVQAGTTFTNAFVTTSVCCPSRASILTGQYVHSHGILDNRFPMGGFRKFFENGQEKSTVATWLHDAGYRTGLVGKYLNFYPQKVKNPTYVPPGWDDWHALFFPESYYEFQMNDNGTVVNYDDDYQTDVLQKRALELRGPSESNDEQPFFLYLSAFAPHAPAMAAVRHEGLLPGLAAPRPPSFNEEDVADKPAWVRALPAMTEETVTKTDEWHRRRVLTMQGVDEMLRAIVDALGTAGELDHTYILFTSDNGFDLGAHRMDHGKGDAYEDAIRVPMIVRGPGVPAGARVDSFVLNIDIAPTLADLGGARWADFVDGRSFAHLLPGRRDAAKSWRKDFLIEHWTSDEDGLPQYAALRTADHKYVLYASGERELYDLKKDPYEMSNLASGPPSSLSQKLAARLAVLKDCRATGCR